PHPPFVRRARGRGRRPEGPAAPGSRRGPACRLPAVPKRPLRRPVMASIHLLVFVKAPLPGEVKTRLARTIGAERACGVYRALARDTLEWAAALSGIEVSVLFSPPGSLELVEPLLPRDARAPVALLPQCEGDLGARMEHAFAQAFDAGARQAIAIGTDCALLGPAEVRESVRLLDAHDIVLGPAKDGGYYLIGLRSRAPELFSGVPWSSERVL